MFSSGLTIVENIIRAVDKSSRTVIILSKNYIKSEYCEAEFDAAHIKKRLIVVVYGELPPKSELPAVVGDYIRTNTYLSHDDDWFWEKLRYRLWRLATASHNNTLLSSA